jgi:hypothetical protein
MRAGDTVKHRPTGETWRLAYVNGRYLAWCGWPPGEALVSDCELVKACSDAEHRDMLEKWAKMPRVEDWDARKSVCLRQLGELNQEWIGAGL